MNPKTLEIALNLLNIRHSQIWSFRSSHLISIHRLYSTFTMLISFFIFHWLSFCLIHHFPIIFGPFIFLANFDEPIWMFIIVNTSFTVLYDFFSVKLFICHFRFPTKFHIVGFIFQVYIIFRIFQIFRILKFIADNFLKFWF